MKEKLINSQLVKQNGWKQGSCLQVDNKIEIYITTQCMQERLPDGLYVVLSQDCDILNKSLRKEPVVELIHANAIESGDPELTSGKNPRQLHLNIGENRHLEFLSHKRYYIARDLLETVQAATPLLTNQPLRALINWIVKRYKRHGFPDAFNSRIDSNTIKKIKKIIGVKAEKSLGLFIRIAPEEELTQDKIYKLYILLLVPKDVYEKEQELLQIEEAFEKIVDLLARVKGIEILAGSQVRSLDDLSVHRYSELKQLDFDYLSFEDGRDGQLAGDII